MQKIKPDQYHYFGGNPLSNTHTHTHPAEILRVGLPVSFITYTEIHLHTSRKKKNNIFIPQYCPASGNRQNAVKIRRRKGVKAGQLKYTDTYIKQIGSLFGIS